MEKVEEFLESNQKVFLLLGDSGAGKSTFNRQLECKLWSSYKMNSGRIPLHIILPTIDKPEQDMIAKQLRKAEFTETEIRELKMHRNFVLICDGYDESHQTHNLYMSNQLNQPGEWSAQMVVSCRSEYLGIDYRDRFQPGDRNSRPEHDLLQEAVITPFTPQQVQEYIKQYVSVHQPLWEAKDYEQALNLIPGLKELVTNPFLMALSLEVLPRMMDPGKHPSATKVTRVALYDQFIEHWLERGKKRLSEKELSPQAKAAFENLIDEGFTRNGVDFLKKLAAAIYKEQDGQPIIRYSRFQEEGRSWKTLFFGREDEMQLLREACPLTRSGNQHRFIHRSLLEYGLALAVFDPNDWKEKPLTWTSSGRRGSTGSAYSFRLQNSVKETDPVKQGPDLNSPLAWRYLVDEPSILQFLGERVQQEPVFKQQLLNYIEHSKTDKKWRTAAANAITILVRAEVQFNGKDLRGIRIPGADLSFGVFDSAQLQAADLRQVNLRGAWLCRADMSGSQLGGVQFGELPFLRENDKVWSCAYSPDGGLLAVGLFNGDISVYSTSSWKRVGVLIGHTRQVNSIAYSPKGDQVISSSNDGMARLWNVESGTCIHTFKEHNGYRITYENRPIEVGLEAMDVWKGGYSVAFSPLGGTVAYTSDEGARVWDVRTGECRLVLIGHTGYVSGVVYSPKGHQIASRGGEDNSVRIWDVETGMCLHTLNCSRTISGVTYSSRGEWIASSHYYKTRKPKKRHEDRSKKQDMDESIVEIWNVESGACRILTSDEGRVNSVVFSPQGDLIASAYYATIRIWDVEAGSRRQLFSGHTDRVNCVVFSPKGDSIACGSDDYTVRLWDVGSGWTRQITRGHDQCVPSVKFSPHGGQVASCSWDGSIRLWDAESGVGRHVLVGHRGWVMSIAYSPQGNYLVSGSLDKELRLWNVETGACRHTFLGHAERISVVAFSPQGDQVVSGDYGGSVKIWDVETGECRHTFTEHTDKITCVEYSPRGNRMASSSQDRTIRLWDVESGACCHILSGHDAWIWSIIYSPGGDILASVGYDMAVRLWDVETGECRRVLIGHTKNVLVVVYSPQGDQVTSGGYDGSARIWDVGTGECLRTLAGHTMELTAVVYSPRGDQIVSGSLDRTARLWDVASGQCRAVAQVFDASIRAMAWSTISDTNCFITGCDDGSVSVWQVVQEDEDTCHVQMRWRTVNGELNLNKTLIHDVHGSSRLNKQLLRQRGAVGEPSSRLRDASEKVMSMVSVVSALQ